jgi:formate dehydrogenase subunit beta
VSAAQDKIRELAQAALADGRVDYVIGWKAGFNTSEIIPAFVRSADDVDQLVWNPLAHNNLTTFLKRKMPDPPNAKIGVCVKGCDSRTLVSLLQENLVDRERLYIIGVPCDGVVSRRKIEKAFSDEVVDIAFVDGKVTATTRQGESKDFAKDDLLFDHCKSCRFPNPRVFDDLAADELAEPADQAPMWASVEEFEALSPAERDAKLEEMFETCIRCFACIHACPVCYCWDQCVNRSRTPALVSQKVTAKDNLMFQMVHMFHVAGRCPSCGNCDRACPVEIPLHLLHRKMNKELFDMLGFEAGVSLDEKPAFQVFKLDDALGEH